MKNRIKKCGSCVNFTKMKNLNRRKGSGLCEYWDFIVSTGDSGCKIWEGTKIPDKIGDESGLAEV